MSKHYTANRTFFYGVLAVAFISVLCYGTKVIAATPSLSTANEKIVRTIAVQLIMQTLENSATFEEASSKIGVTPDELRDLCIALKIEIDFPSQEVKPVPIASLEKLTDKNFEAESILKYNGLSPYVILVDKSAHTLYLLEYENGERKNVLAFDCETGRNSGDKREEGDNKTPEGIYLIINKYSRSEILRLVGRNKAYQYGEMAFVINFPNPLDHAEGKNGGGIWLHGRDEPPDNSQPNGTHGCVVVTNETIKMISKYVKLNSTPIIIVDKLKILPKEDTETKSNEILELVEKWRSAWETKSIDEYISYYSPSFISQGRNRTQWKNYKADRVFRYVNINHIKLDNFAIFQHGNEMVVHFLQDYSASNLSGKGIKTLYLRPGKYFWEIVAESIRSIPR
ncbi:murein L,D-transpeptidase family protein [Candidatus Latescibacterota bacterium]